MMLDKHVRDRLRGPSCAILWRAALSQTNSELLKSFKHKGTMVKIVNYMHHFGVRVEYALVHLLNIQL